MTLKKTIIFIVAVGAAVLLPLGLISGAVESISSHTEYQVASTPQATIKVDNITSSTAHIQFSIDRSNMVIDSSSNASATDGEITTKFKYCSDYNILILKMTAYNEAVKKITGNQVIRLDDYVDRTYEVRDDDFIYDGKSHDPVDTLTIVNTYLLTADTVFQEDKEYFTKNGAEYELATIKTGAEIEKGVYYEKAENTTFDFYIGNLNSEYTYAVAIQFYYSTDDVRNTLYNNGYKEREEFITKAKQ